MEKARVTTKPLVPDPFLEDRFVRGRIYAFLGRLFLREMDQETLCLMNEANVHSAFMPLGLKVPAEDGTGETLECLAMDYCGVFLGPSNHVPPIQSVWDSGLLSGPAVDSMRSYLEFVSVDCDQDTMIDHFGFQLQVMGVMLASPVRQDEVGLIGNWTRDFFQQHVQWAGKWLPRAGMLAKTAFYQSLMEVTDIFLTDEFKRMEEPAADG